MNTQKLSIIEQNKILARKGKLISVIISEWFPHQTKRKFPSELYDATNTRDVFYYWYRAARCHTKDWPIFNFPEKIIAQSALYCRTERDFTMRSSPYFFHSPILPR